MFIQMLMHGITFKSGKVGPIRIRPAVKSITIPPLVGMIIFGCLARNFLCAQYMDHYPEYIAGWIK